jgi:hypothetical protein
MDTISYAAEVTVTGQDEPVRCPKCGGEIQATRKTYYTWSTDKWIPGPSGEDWDVYCENDHQLGGTDGMPRREDLDRLREVQP